jgi:hypothetical protein
MPVPTRHNPNRAARRAGWTGCDVMVARCEPPRPRSHQFDGHGKNKNLIRSFQSAEEEKKKIPTIEHRPSCCSKMRLWVFDRLPFPEWRPERMRVSPNSKTGQACRAGRRYGGGATPSGGVRLPGNIGGAPQHSGTMMGAVGDDFGIVPRSKLAIFIPLPRNP